MFLTASDGVRIAVVDHQLQAPVARVLIVHGYAEHLGRYADLVWRLAAAGLECHLFDLRGHGHSEGTSAHVSDFQLYIDDLQRIVDHVRTASSVPFFIIGHSLGGLIALEFASTRVDPCDGLIVSAPYLRPAFKIPRFKRILASVASRIAPALPFNNTLKPEWLSTDPRVGEAYAADPLVKRTTTPRWFTEVERVQGRILDRATNLTVPLLMLLGAEDRIADNRIAEAAFSATGSADKRLKVYPGMRHEIFNEIEREIVINDAIQWLRSRCAAAPKA